MYDKLVKRLREEASSWCTNCCYRAGDCICAAPDDRKKDCDIASKLQAADAIEDLSQQFDNMNEANIALYGALPKWIPVTEQTPDEYTTILFITGGGDLRVGYYDGDHKSYCDMTGFRYMCTHWMPAPQPPEKE